MTELAYIGIGANLGDRQGYLTAGLGDLLALPGIELEAVSSLYETAPIGYLDQPLFLNAVLAVRTALPPLAMLRAMQRIEHCHHRQRRIHWGPRTLDLDLLLHGTCTLSTPNLTLPHPRMSDRAFVLEPLCEIAPQLHHPVTGKAFAARLAELGGAQTVRRLGPFPLPHIPHRNPDIHP